MTQRVYEPIPEAERSALMSALDSGDPERVARGLLGLAFNDADWRFVQNQCVARISDPSPQVRGIAVLCLGHLATFHGEIDVEVVVPLVKAALADPDPFVRGHADSARADVTNALSRPDLFE